MTGVISGVVRPKYVTMNLSFIYYICICHCFDFSLKKYVYYITLSPNSLTGILRDTDMSEIPSQGAL